jgi:Asp-tRNA(Asn)/Glu-tRNA(Gln) amidotransferase A subunit family amidase
LLDQHQHFLEQVERLRSKYDAVLCPVSSLPALRHGTAARLVAAAAPCLLANLADLSAGVVPVTRVAATEEQTRSWSPDRVLRAAAATERHSAGLPIGVQIVGLAKGPAAERVVLDLLATIERGSDFSRLARR